MIPTKPGFLADAAPPPLVAFLVVVAFTTAVAYAISFPISRLAGIAASIATFAFLLVIHTIANNLDTITRGRATMFGVPHNTTLGVALLGAVVGSVAIWAIQQVLRDVEAGVSLGPVTIGESPGLSQVGLALAPPAILLFRPAGITNGKEIPARPPRRRAVRDLDEAAPAPANHAG